MAGWTTYNTHLVSAYLKMGKMGATAFTSYGNLRTAAGK